MNNFCGTGIIDTIPKTGKTLTGVNFIKFIVKVERPKAKNGTVSFDRIPVGCWGPVCQYAQYLEKDDEIEFQGSLSTSSKQDQNGNWSNTFEIVVKSIKMTKKAGTLQAAQPMTPNPVPVPQPAPAPVPPPMTPPPVVDETMPFDVYGGYYG